MIKLTILLTTFTMMSCGKISFTNKQLSQPEQLTFVANESGTSKDSLALNKLAKQTVVEIVSEGYSVEGNKYIPKGSGVIIGRKDSVYYVLTTNHISNVNDELSVFIPGEKPEKGLEVTPLKFINRYPQEDLALLAFASLTDYRVMDLGEVSQLDDDSQVYIAGWAGYDNREGFQFTPTKVTNSQMGNNLTYKSTEPEEAFYKEMSGGAVLNKAGQLVGIHAGLAKADGDGKGVLISTFLRMVSPEVKDLLLRATPTVTLESLTVKNSENVALSPTRDAEITPISYRGIFLRILQVFVLLLLLYFFFIVFYLHIYSCWKKNLNAKNYFHQGLKHHNQEEYDLAIAKYNQAILLHPKYADAYNNRGNIYDHQGKYDLALADYSQAIQLEPKYAKVYYNRGIIYSNQGKYDLALADYNKAIQLKPKYANAYNNRGNIYDNQGKYDLALADYNQAIQLEPKYAEPYNNRGWAYDNQGKYDLALADYNQAIQLHPRYVKAYNNRGIVYSNQGKYDLAIADYNKAIQLYPKYAHAYYNRGLVNKTKGNTERAILDFEKAAELYKEEENQRSYQGSLEQLKELQPVYGDQEKSEKEEVFTFQVVRVNDSGKIINRTQKSVRQKIEDLGNDVRLEIVYIPEGSFIMGSPIEKAARNSCEGPQHKMTLQPFYMSKYPITQEQYEVIMGNNPSRFIGEKRPVEKVSWQDARKFCQRLSRKMGRDYRLPRESQWEYACRAGTTTPFNFGKTITPELVNYNGKYPYGNAPKGKYRQQTTDVGIFPPNAFGLYDMYGNVWEWCAEEWDDNYDGASRDGNVRLDRSQEPPRLRGGSWFSSSNACRSTYRLNIGRRDIHSFNIGFRVVCSVARVF